MHIEINKLVISCGKLEIRRFEVVSKLFCDLKPFFVLRKLMKSA